MSTPRLEICTADIESVKNAIAGGADRIELCSALSEGGVTPSIGLIHQAINTPGNITVHVLIRPRGGDFLYDSDEVETMLHDIKTAKQMGAHGVVIGALTPQGDIDMDICRRLVNAAEGMNITFHRAFDLCRNPEKSLGEIIELGCNRLLTSGQSLTAEQGIPMLRQLVRLTDNRLQILAGSGVTPHNAYRIMHESGVSEVHASARQSFPSKMQFRHNGVSMGANDADEYTRMATSADIVKQLAKIVHQQNEQTQ